MVPESRRVPFESLTTSIDFGKMRSPLLMIASSSDHIIPASLNRRNHARYRRSTATTDFKEFSGCTHFIIGQQNWEEVADYILDSWMVKRTGIVGGRRKGEAMFSKLITR